MKFFKFVFSLMVIGMITLTVFAEGGELDTKPNIDLSDFAVENSAAQISDVNLNTPKEKFRETQNLCQLTASKTLISDRPLEPDLFYKGPYNYKFDKKITVREKLGYTEIMIDPGWYN